MSTIEFIYNKFDCLLVCLISPEHFAILESGALNNDLNLYCLVDKLMLGVIHAGK